MIRKITPILLEFKGEKLYLNLGKNRKKIISKAPEGMQEIDVCSEWKDDIPYLVLYTTYSCNLSCQYCFLRDLKGKEVPTTPQYTLNDLYNFLLFHQINSVEIRFFGGEPLLNKSWIYECVKFLEEKNIKAKYNIFTNAILIDDKLIEFCKEKGIRIFVSVAGHNEEEKGLKYKKIIQNNIAKVNKNKLVCMGRTIYRPEEISLVELVKETMDTNLQMISITPEWGRIIDLKIAYQHLSEFCDFYIEKIKCFEFDMIGIHPFSGYIIKWLLGKQYDVNQCGCGKKLYSIAINGDVYPCPCFTENKKYMCGNLYGKCDSLFGELNAETIIKCKNCDIKYLCRYRCYADAFLSNGTVLCFDEKKCEYERAVVSCSAYILYTLQNKFPKQYSIFYDLLKRARRKDISH